MRVSLKSIKPYSKELSEFLLNVGYETIEEFMNKYPLVDTEHINNYGKETVFNAMVRIYGYLNIDIYEFDMLSDEVRALAYWLGKQNTNDTKYLIDKLGLDANFMTLDVTLFNLYDELENALGR